MKKQTIIYVGIIFVFGFVSIAYGQQPKRKVGYTTLTEHFFSIPNTTEFKRLNDLDYNKMNVEDKRISTEIEIDQNHYITITKRYLNGERYENDYENMISKSISRRDETTLYDKRDQVLYYYQSGANDILSNPLSEEEVRNYGEFSSGFLIPYQQMALYLRNNGYNVQYINGRQTLIAINREVEITIDYRNYLYEMRCFHQNNFYYSTTTQYQKWNNYIIPYIEINMSQDTLSDGSPFMKSEWIRYIDYMIIDEKGNKIIDYHNPDIEGVKNHHLEQYQEITQRDIELKLFPNPTSDYFTIQFPFYMEAKITVEVSNSLGTTIIKKEQLGQDPMSIDLTGYPSGIYLIKCNGDGVTKTAKIVKN